MRELLEIGRSGMFANQKSLDVVGQNIANANTPGYSRQRVELDAIEFRKGGLSVGLGVNVETVKQLRDTLVETQIQSKEGDLGGLNEKIKLYEQLEVLFASGSDNDLDKLMTKFFNSFSELSNNPESLALRENVVFSAQNMTSRFNEIAANLDSFKDSTAKEARTLVGEVNRLTSDIAKLNVQIANVSGTGQADNKALDLRATRLNELSKLVDINTIYSNNGSVEVRIGNLVVVQHERTFTVEPEIDSTNNSLRLRLNNGRTMKNVGGQLGAMIDSYENVLPEFKTKIDTLASNLVSKVNAIHVNGFNLKDTSGIDFFKSGNTTASSISVNSQIAQDVSLIAASTTAGTPGDNTAARQIFSLLDNSSAVDNRSFIEYSLGIAAETGFSISGMRTQVESITSSKQMLENQKADASGVNMDEELANMIKFQNAYQASARVIASVQVMYDTVLSLI
jgi:flagellar hook-associated protein 1